MLLSLPMISLLNFIGEPKLDRYYMLWQKVSIYKNPNGFMKSYVKSYSLLPKSSPSGPLQSWWNTCFSSAPAIPMQYDSSRVSIGAHDWSPPSIFSPEQLFLLALVCLPDALAQILTPHIHIRRNVIVLDPICIMN